MSEPKQPTKLELGRATRASVLGEAHVARSEASRTGFDGDFVDFITETAWGTLWARPGLTRRERSMVTISILAALGRLEELELHLKATRNTGASAEDVKEALLHVAVYAGVPAANTAFKMAKAVFAAPPEP